MSGDGDVVVFSEAGDGRVAIIRLNRPQQRNALVWETWTRLGDDLDALGAEKRFGAVVLGGVGGFFSAGGDLKSTPARGTGPLSAAARLEHAQDVLRRLRATTMPVVAAVEGGAVGLGWSLVLSCDIVVAASDAFFSAPFVSRGVVPDGGAAWYLTERLGRHRASELLFTGVRLPVPEAHALGLVNRVCAPGEAEAEALSLATAIAGADRGATEMTKRLLARAEAMTLEDFHALELAMGTIAQQRGSAAAARDAFR